MKLNDISECEQKQLVKMSRDYNQVYILIKGPNTTKHRFRCSFTFSV